MPKINFGDAFKLPSEEEMRLIRIDMFKDLTDNPNNRSFWFPRIVDAFRTAPSGHVVGIPLDTYLETYPLTYFEAKEDTDRQRGLLLDLLKDSIPLEDLQTKDYMVKNGVYSDKFDFKQDFPRTHEEVLDRWLQVNYEGLLRNTGGHTEINLIEFIHPQDGDSYGNIYGELPLRTEVRVFYDFSRKEIVKVVNYWNWDPCFEGISYNEDDLKVYINAYDDMEETIRSLFPKIEELEDRLREVEDLNSIWSVDFMWTDNQFYLIDMAVGHQSAYWNLAKEVLDKKSLEKIVFWATPYSHF